MDRPQLIYWLLVGTVALPLAVLGRERVAAAVFGVLLAAMVLIGLLGLPVFGTYAVLHAAGFAWSRRWARGVNAHAVGSLFVVLALLDLWGAAYDPARAWWAVFWVAIAQCLLLPFIADWARIRKAVAILGKIVSHDRLERSRI